MKIITPGQMAEIEALAYSHGASSSDFMEEAGSGVALVVHEYVERHQLDHMALLLCGKGNNGGDAYVAGTHLLDLDYDVAAIPLVDPDSCTSLCKQNYERFIRHGGRILDINAPFPKRGIIIDGIFGTGFHGVPSDPFDTIMARANESKLPIIAIDIPSGLNGKTGKVPGEAIIAAETAFLGLPKTGFFLNEGWNYVGKLRHVNFGLPPRYLQEFVSDEALLTIDAVRPYLPPIVRNRHKYTAGHVIGLAGSPGMPGAAILSAITALKSGSGIVRILHPKGMEAELSSCPYELIRVPYEHSDVDAIAELMNQASATFIGPGLGRSSATRTLLEALLPRLEKPCVIDGDALYLLADDSTIPLPKQTIMTPHMGELMHLLKLSTLPTLNVEFLNNCRNFATKRKVLLLLKGAPSFIFQEGTPICISPFGDPGMATAGSGDVLTGLITSLLAQGRTPFQAASLGVVLHGLAGEQAAEELTSYGMTASDIIYNLPEAFRMM